MSDADIAYYRQRAIDERALALRTERRDVAEIHLELARLYQALVDEDELRAAASYAPVTRKYRRDSIA